MRRERLRTIFAGAALALFAAALTAWLLASARIPRSADQAVVGLMARHILEGRGHPVFYWGSTYGGTLEPHLLVPVFAAFGATFAALRGFYVVLWAAFLAGGALVTRRFFGDGPALAAAAYLAFPPFFLPYKMLTSDGAYASVALLGLAALGLALEIDRRAEAGARAGAYPAALGLVAGVGLWVTPVTLPVVAAAAGWLLAGRRLRPRDVVLGIAAAFAGAAPSIVWNLRHGGTSLAAPELAPAAGSGLAGNLAAFFATTVPVLLGAARPHTSGGEGVAFPGAVVVMPAVLLLLLAAAGAAAARGDRKLRLLFLALFLVAAAAVVVRRLDPSEPRYLVAAYAALAPLVGVSVARLVAAGGGPRAAGLCGLALLLAGNVLGAVHAHRHVTDTGEDQVTAPMGALLTDLRRLGVTRAFANYWTAYRVSFESGGDVLAAPFALEGGERVAWIREAVVSAPAAAAILLPPRDACFRRALEESRAAFRETRSGAFAVFDRLPADVASVLRAGTVPLPRAGYAVAWDGAALPSRLAPGATAAGTIAVRNEGPCTWKGSVRLVAAWEGPESRADVVSAPGREVGPGDRAEMRVPLRAPAVPGRYRLVLDLEQAGVARFSERGGSVFSADVDVAP